MKNDRKTIDFVHFLVKIAFLSLLPYPTTLPNTWYIINNPNDDVNTQKVVILVLDKVIGSKMQFSLKNGQNQWFSGHFSLNKIVF